MKKIYSKTAKLREAKFRAQRALVVEALSSCSAPITLEALAALVDRDGRYSSLLNDWAKENGGVKGGICYHLREMGKRGMVKITHSPNPCGRKLLAGATARRSGFSAQCLMHCRSAKETKL